MRSSAFDTVWPSAIIVARVLTLLLSQGRAVWKKGGVTHLAHTRGHCITFWPSVPPLQVAPSFACSVASLSRFPGHQLPGFHSLRHGILADYLLGQGGPSTCVTGQAVLQCTPSPKPPLGNRRLDTPNVKNVTPVLVKWRVGRRQSAYTKSTGGLCKS